jgi:hypothetical protein
MSVNESRHEHGDPGWGYHRDKRDEATSREFESSIIDSSLRHGPKLKVSDHKFQLKTYKEKSDDRLINMHIKSGEPFPWAVESPVLNAEDVSDFLLNNSGFDNNYYIQIRPTVVSYDMKTMVISKTPDGMREVSVVRRDGRLLS